MPTFFPDGRVLAGCTGGGEGPASIDNGPIAGLGAARVSSIRPLSNDEVIYSIGDRAVEILTLSTRTTRVACAHPANWVEGSGGGWAVRLESRPPVYADSFGRSGNLPWKPLHASAAGVLALGYHTGGLAWLPAGGGIVDLFPAGTPMFGEGAQDAGWWVARISETELAVGRVDGTDRRALRVPQSVKVAVAWPFCLIWSHAHQSFVVIDCQTGALANLNTAEGFNPAIRVAGSTLSVAGSSTLGEAPGTMWRKDFDIGALQWVTRARPEIPRDVATWPRKLWISAFFSHSTRYGDTDDLIGNAITVVGDERDPAVLAAEISRLTQVGQPMIIAAHQDGANPSANLNLTVAWWVSGASMAQVSDAVRRAQALPEKPIVAYCDRTRNGPRWPSVRPDGWSSRVWPSIQAYRFPGELLEDFAQRVEADIAAAATWAPFVALTLRTDNFNGSVHPDDVVECLPFYEAWARRFPVVLLHLFADRRGFGLAQWPELRAWAHRLQAANPAQRPNRFDYWQRDAPNDEDVRARLRNKLGQSTEVVILSADEKAFLLSRL